MTQNDLQTLDAVQGLERLYLGNKEKAATTEELAQDCDLPPRAIKAMHDFWALRKQDFKSSNLPPRAK